MRPPGSVVAIYFDGLHQLDVGEALVTGTGRAYLVVERRVQTRGAHAGRQHLRCVVHAAAADLPPDTETYPIEWYPRRRRTVTPAR